jgi:hypothetical protein
LEASNPVKLKLKTKYLKLDADKLALFLYGNEGVKKKMEKRKESADKRELKIQVKTQELPEELQRNGINPHLGEAFLPLWIKSNKSVQQFVEDLQTEHREALVGFFELDFFSCCFFSEQKRKKVTSDGCSCREWNSNGLG